MWITITADHVKTRLAGVELSAYQTVALAAGQVDPLPEIIASVTDEVRGYIGACAKNTYGPAGTIPERLLTATLNIIRYRLTTRLPLKVTDARKTEYDDAIKLMEQVAACRFAVEDPNASSPDTSVSSPSPHIAPKCRRFTHRQQEGS